METTIKISPYITFAEAVKSPTAVKLGIDNTPGTAELESMKYLAANVFDNVRSHFNRPIAVTSFYRSAALNKAVGGASASQHVTGEAMDMDADLCGGLSNRDIFEYIRVNLTYDQLIWEFGDRKSPQWVHVSLTRSRNRREVLRSALYGGKIVYEAHVTA